MKIDFIPKFVMLLAGAIVSIITIVNDMDTTYSLEILLGTLIVFYIIGIIAKKLIQKVISGNMFVKRQTTSGINVDIPEESTMEREENTESSSDIGQNEE